MREGRKEAAGRAAEKDRRQDRGPGFRGHVEYQGQ